MMKRAQGKELFSFLSCILHLVSCIGFFPLTIAEAIYQAAQKLSALGIPNARLDAEVLLSYILGKDRAWLITHGKEALEREGQNLFEDALDRRSRREPLQYIIGRQEFWGLEFIVTPDVLIPRPETELLVETAVKILKGNSTRAAIADLCTGSGCIAISLAKELPDARIFATDTSARALVVARENARTNGVADRIRFFEGDLLHPFEELDLQARLDVITANPPYIRAGDLPMLQAEVRDYEPQVALIAGPDGTEIQKEIIENAPAFLKKQGALIMEMGLGQAETLTRMAAAAGGYGKPEILKDLAGIDRVIVTRRI
jgi:release factor glutamine methyltransferase